MASSTIDSKLQETILIYWYRVYTTMHLKIGLILYQRWKIPTKCGPLTQNDKRALQDRLWLCCYSINSAGKWHLLLNNSVLSVEKKIIKNMWGNDKISQRKSILLHPSLGLGNAYVFRSTQEAVRLCTNLHDFMYKALYSLAKDPKPSMFS